MKETYLKPVAKLDEFKTVDVITTSYGDGGEGNVDGGDEDLG